MKNNVLAYHSVGEHPIKEIGAGLYSVPLEKFREQMAYIVGSRELGAGRIRITFDDGDMTNYLNAYPILKELGLKGCFFIIGERVGTDGYMSWKQIKELQNAGMIIGSHGMTHRILLGLRDGEIEYELVESKKLLEENLKTRIDYLSIPRGFYNKKIIDKATDAGYKTIFTSDSRIVVRPGWDLKHFSKVLNNGYLFQDKIEDVIKNSIRGVLGTKNYDRIRTMLLR